MPKKKDKFYICILWITNRYNTVKSHKKDAHRGLIILILKLQENSLGCHADLFISSLTYHIFLFNYKICRFFPMFLTFFVNHVLFYIFHLGKLLLTPNTLIVIPVNLNFFLISDNSPLLFWAYQFISLLNLTNPATTILYHSSLAISFSSVR